MEPTATLYVLAYSKISALNVTMSQRSLINSRMHAYGPGNHRLPLKVSMEGAVLVRDVRKYMYVEGGLHRAGKADGVKSTLACIYDGRKKRSMGVTLSRC